jgi:hypothetical protein
MTSSTSRNSAFDELLTAMKAARDALYNGFEPDNQSRAYHAADDAVKKAGLARAATLSEKAPIPPQVPSKPMPYPTKEEIELYRDTFRRELDKRMNTKHPSASPSTESHAIALHQFVENRNAP